MATDHDPRGLLFWLPQPWTFDDLDDAVVGMRRGPRDVFLMTHALGHLGGELAGFHRPHRITKRSRMCGPGRGQLADLLCISPDYKMLKDAVRLIREHGALLVAESVRDPLRGWARAACAVNLRTGKPEPPLDIALIDHIDRLIFYGNNGFYTRTDRGNAMDVLDAAEADGLLSRELPSAALARGLRTDAVDDLRKLIDRTLNTSGQR